MRPERVIASRNCCSSRSAPRSSSSADDIRSPTTCARRRIGLTCLEVESRDFLQNAVDDC